MLSPKSYQYRERKEEKRSQKHRKHLNKKFYNSKEWKRTREAYMMQYRLKLLREIPQGYWITRNKDRIGMDSRQTLYLLSLDFTPCEICLKNFAAGAYNEVEEGIEIDHIIPINPENALDSNGYGNPFDLSNLQLLCKRHHAKKSSRENN